MVENAARRTVWKSRRDHDVVMQRRSGLSTEPQLRLIQKVRRNRACERRGGRGPSTPMPIEKPYLQVQGTPPHRKESLRRDNRAVLQSRHSTHASLSERSRFDGRQAEGPLDDFDEISLFTQDHALVLHQGEVLARLRVRLEPGLVLLVCGEAFERD